MDEAENMLALPGQTLFYEDISISEHKKRKFQDLLKGN